jgi:hypothetical protein
MQSFVRSPASLAWLALSTLTVVSWLLGTDHGFAGNQVLASLAIIVVAVFKVRLVGLYFMELREAPTALRTLFEGYCAILFVLLTAMFLLAF